MAESKTSPTKRTLAHIKRLRQEGEQLVCCRPLDELAHVLWLDRAQKYLERKFPGMEIPRPDQLVDVDPPDLLDPNHQTPHPLDAAMARAQSGRQLVNQFQIILARAAERLELELEQRQ